MYYPDPLPKHDKYSWGFDDVRPYEDRLVKAYYHPISDFLRLHVHDFYELNIVVAGSGRHYIGRHNIPTQIGDVFVIPPEVEHGYYSDGTLNVFHILLSNSFSAKHAEELAELPCYKMLFEIEPTLRCQTKSMCYLTLSGKPFKLCERIISDIQNENEKTDEGRGIRQAFLALTLIGMLCEQMTLGAHSLSENFDRDTISVIKSIERIENEFQNKLPVELLSKECKMSYSTYLRTFRKLTGVTPLQYQRACRLKKAEELLKFSEETILSVALTCGYYDSAHFIREFTAVKGMSPTAYRFGKNP